MNVLAQPLGYQEFVAALNARIVALEVPHEALEPAMGLTGGYLGKLLGPYEVKRFGLIKLFPALEALGLRMALVEHLDLEATRDELGNDYRKRIRSGQRGQMRRVIAPAVAQAVAREMGRRGGSKPKRFALTRERRAYIGKTNVLKRKWRPVKRRYKLGRMR